jgi:ribose transport system permease protein
MNAELFRALPPRLQKMKVRGYAPGGVLVLLILLVGVFQDSFLRASSLAVVAEGVTPILLLALGQTFVILIGGIDLSSAAVASLCALIGALLLPQLGVFALLVVLAVGISAGALQGFVHDFGQIPSLIVTLIGLGIWSGIALALADGQTIRPDAGMEIIAWLKERQIAVRSSLIFAVFTVFISWLVLSRTVLGRRMYAVGANQVVALLSGVPVRLVRVAAFGISGLFAALAGIVLLAELGSASPTLAHVLLLPSLVAVLLGGTAIAGGAGGVWQTLVGVLILGVLRVAFNAIGVDPSVHQLLFGVIVLIAVAISVDRSR